MTCRRRSLPWVVLVVLASWPARSPAQDVPLYRDPSPTEGRRIEGPLLPARPSPVPPPPGTLGPFQPPTPDLDPSAAAPPPMEPLREPLLGVPPLAPPLPALPMPPMQPGGDVVIRRTTKLQGPKGVMGRFHDWFRDACFGPPRPQVVSPTPRRGLLAFLHPDAAGGEPQAHPFNWPAWPGWPLPGGR